MAILRCSHRMVPSRSGSVINLGFAQDGGMVELKRRGARMGLVVNLGALESAGLKASSKLLQLSEVVGETQSD
jgi:hypothetical protein